MTTQWTGTTADLMDKDPDLKVCETPFRSFGKRKRFCGLIMTIECHHDIGILKNVLGQQGRGRVIVVDGRGSMGAALCGGNMAELAMQNGWGGIVINGPVRDTVELEALDFGIKAIGTSPRRPSFAGVGEEGTPLRFGGVEFQAGHWLYSDEDGIVVSPKML